MSLRTVTVTLTSGKQKRSEEEKMKGEQVKVEVKEYGEFRQLTLAALVVLSQS